MVETDQQLNLPEPKLVSAIEEADGMIWELAQETGVTWDAALQAMLEVQSQMRVGNRIGTFVANGFLFLAKVIGIALPPDEGDADTRLISHFQPDQYIGPPDEFLDASRKTAILNKRIKNLK